MAISKAMLQTPLRNIGLSHELILLLEDCNFATVGDYWLHDARLLQSKFYAPSLYTECLHAITLWLAEQIVNEQRMRKQELIKKRKRKKPYGYRWLRYHFNCLLYLFFPYGDPPEVKAWKRNNPDWRKRSVWNLTSDE